MLPNTRLLARAFHRIAPVTGERALSTSAVTRKWEGRQPEEHATRTNDGHNVQTDAVEGGKQERAKGEGSQASSEKDVRGRPGMDETSNEKAKKDHPEAPGPVIGMNDERGGKGH